MLTAHALYGLAWASFGLVHSALADPRAKAWAAPLLGRWYRLAYNLLALLHFAAVALIGRALLGDLAPFPLPAWAVGALLALHVAGWLLLVVALRQYDGRRMLGLRPDAGEPLRTGGLNGVVRHPLYLAGLMILWGMAAHPLGLATAVWGSAYLLIGARLEERKLLTVYGAEYAEYRARVPGFVPRLRW